MDQTRPYWTVQGHMGKYRAIQSHMWPHKAIGDHMDHTGSYSTKLDHTHHTVSYGIIRDHWDHIAPYSHTWSYETKQDPTGPYRTIQDIQG